MPSALVLRAGVSFEDREFWNSSLLISEAVAALICSPIFGYLLDVSGTRQGPYLAGLILLFGSMIIFTASNSILWYTVARILQGGATAMVTVAGFAIVTDAVDKRHLGQMLGYIGTAMTLGFVSGPVLGGVVYSIGGFYAAFGMAFAIIALDLVLRLAVIEKKVAERWVSSPDNGVVSRRDHDHNHQSVLIALWAVIVSAIVASAFDATLTIFVETIFHWDVLGAGLIFIPGASVAILQPLFGYLTDRLGSRIIAFSSFVILSPTLVLLRFVEENTFQHKAILCVILATVGMCIDLGEPALLVELQKVLDDMEAEDPSVFGGQGAVGQAFGLQSMAHFGGFALGPMIGGFVSFHYGWDVMTLSLGLLSLVTAVPMMWLSGPIKDDQISETERDPLIN
ncbi:hypothetical protein N7533_003947 [Penicillium manginii]|uniref:uncharacterized protein n=1 Tax=Penicillium manginii TaxID=203109 RepID=UPI002549595A|nr:uncharacterized protein N7533_003947 [Penicillium manginii]KAJ5754404.1 hypothetical protein N7533_003947 [Penicillium manginii]